jgi:hypothetical protein
MMFQELFSRIRYNAGELGRFTNYYVHPYKSAGGRSVRCNVRISLPEETYERR